MPGNLPPILPSSKSSGNSLHGIGRAQNFSTSKLQQHKDRENATVSANQAINQSRSQRTTSINHSTSQPTSSISRPQKEVRSVNDQNMYDENADDRRYEYYRSRIRKRLQEAKEAGKLARQEKENDLHVGTGRSFVQKGKKGFDRRLRKFFRKGKYSKYKNLSKEDQEIFRDTVSKYAKNKKTGSSFSYKEKKKMKRDIAKHRRKREISKEDQKDFNKIISNLDN